MVEVRTSKDSTVVSVWCTQTKDRKSSVKEDNDIARQEGAPRTRKTKTTSGERYFIRNKSEISLTIVENNREGGVSYRRLGGEKSGFRDKNCI